MPPIPSPPLPPPNNFCKVWLKSFLSTSLWENCMAVFPTNFDHIKRAVDLFDWESALTDLDVNDQVSIFNNAITNIMSNCVPCGKIICDDRDSPWMNRHIKNLILYQVNFYKTFVHRIRSMFHLLLFHNLQNHLNQFIQKAKQSYLSKVASKRSDPSTSTKYYWSLLKALLNDQKITCIPPTFHNNKYIVGFKKWNIQHFFAEQCCLIPSISVLPSQWTLLTGNPLSKCNFSKQGIFPYN